VPLSQDWGKWCLDGGVPDTVWETVGEIGAVTASAGAADKSVVEPASRAAVTDRAGAAITVAGAGGGGGGAGGLVAAVDGMV